MKFIVILKYKSEIKEEKIFDDYNSARDYAFLTKHQIDEFEILAHIET
jgi:hypothetical protein